MAGKSMWMVRAGEGSQFISEFLEHSYVAIGWGNAGELAKGASKAEIAKRVEKTWPQSNKFKVANAAGQINRFLTEISIGDWVETYDSSRRVYHLGKVVSDPRFETSETIELRRQRAVAWEGEVPRDNLTVPTKNTLGAIQTLFLLSDSARDLTSRRPEFKALRGRARPF